MSAVIAAATAITIANTLALVFASSSVLPRLAPRTAAPSVSASSLLAPSTPAGAAAVGVGSSGIGVGSEGVEGTAFTVSVPRLSMIFDHLIYILFVP